MRLRAFGVIVAVTMASAGPSSAPPAAAEPASPSPPAASPSIPGRVLTLPEVVSIALETQPLIQGRLFDYAAARFRVDQALAPLLPHLAASWTAARDRAVFGLGQATQAEARNAGEVVRSDTPLRVTENIAALSLSQLLFDFGQTLAATDLAKRFADVAKEDVELQRDLIVLAVKEAAFNWLLGMRLIRVETQSLERARVNLYFATRFFVRGVRPQAAVKRAEVDVANAQVALIRARNATALARVALNTAMGIPGDTPTEVEDVLSYQPFVADRADLFAEARRGRPEMRQAELRVQAAQAALQFAGRSFLPTLTGNAYVGSASPDFHEIWGLGGTLNWSLFDGGATIGRYREATAALEGADAQLRATGLAIDQEIEQARLNVETAAERIPAAKAAVDAAQLNFGYARRRFQTGVGTVLDLTDAQLALTQAEESEVQALADYRIAIARLERAVGRR
jgi:outer membrane protein